MYEVWSVGVGEGAWWCEGWLNGMKYGWNNTSLLIRGSDWTLLGWCNFRQSY